jgi:hypothetical protein
VRVESGVTTKLSWIDWSPGTISSPTNGSTVMSRAGGGSSGTKVVIACVTATLATVGIGSIYLPFIADRDRIRGMHEEGDLSPSERREYDRMMRQYRQDMMQQQPSESNPTFPKMPSNSVWQRMNDAAKANRESSEK